MAYDWTQLGISEITSLYLYGQITPPGDLINQGMIRPTLAPNVAAITVETDAVAFMQTGSGRFATGAVSPLNGANDAIYENNFKREVA